MALEARLKIDAGRSSIFMFVVYRREQTIWGRERWETLESFRTLEEAQEYVEKIKALPIYF